MPNPFPAEGPARNALDGCSAPTKRARKRKRAPGRGNVARARPRAVVRGRASTPQLRYVQIVLVVG